MDQELTAGTARMYFRVPGHYGYGPDYDTWAAAESAAVALISEIDGCPGSFTRAFVEVRLSDPTGDRPVHRVELKLSGATAGNPAQEFAAKWAEDRIEYLRSVDEELHGLGEIDGGGA